jgi:hypothetical protein
MPYTEMDNITSSKLNLISERARKDPKFQFTSLAHLLNEGFLKECYFKRVLSARVYEMTQFRWYRQLWPASSA